MNDATGDKFGDEESEPGPKEHIMELKEVTGPDFLCMCPEESCPCLTVGSRRTCLPDMPLDRALGYLDAQFQQLALNALHSPQAVAPSHVLDQDDRPRRHPRCAGSC